MPQPLPVPPPLRFLRVESLPYDTDASSFGYRVGQRCYGVQPSPSDPVQLLRCTSITLENRLGQWLFIVRAVPEADVGVEGEAEIAAMAYVHTPLMWVHPEDRERWHLLGPANGQVSG